MTKSCKINHLIRFKFSLRPKLFFVKNFSSYKDFQEFSILGGGVSGILPPLAIPALIACSDTDQMLRPETRCFTYFLVTICISIRDMS